MMGELDGRIALVTGGGRGVGRAIAIELAASGAAVALTYRRDEDAANEAVAHITAAGGRAKAYKGSVEVWDDDVAVVEQVTSDLGTIGILINNAGIASRGNSVADTDPAEMERVVRTHAFGPHYLSKLVIPGMRTLDRGDIIMISSMATFRMPANGGPYNMGKAAMEALALTLSNEEAPNGIRVHTVCPGIVSTDMGDRLAKAAAGVPTAADLDSMVPLGHVCRPEDVARVVSFLVSPQGAFLTGQRIGVDGGGFGTPVLGAANRRDA